MAEGFQDAAGRRNWLERLGERIPGFRGFQDRELRREVDKLQREYLAKELSTMKKSLRTGAERYTDAGKLGSLHLFDRLDRRLDGLSQAIRFSDYGATGFFDVVKIGEKELETLYEFDVAILTEIAGLRDDLALIPPPGSTDPAEVLDRASARLGSLEDKWTSRRNVISNVVKTAG